MRPARGGGGGISPSQSPPAPDCFVSESSPPQLWDRGKRDRAEARGAGLHFSEGVGPVLCKCQVHPPIGLPAPLRMTLAWGIRVSPPLPAPPHLQNQKHYGVWSCNYRKLVVLWITSLGTIDKHEPTVSLLFTVVVLINICHIFIFYFFILHLHTICVIV